MTEYVSYVVLALFIFAILFAQRWKQAPAIICPHCRHTGGVKLRERKRKTGLSGGKVVGGLLTGGISLLATGISRNASATECRCSVCETTWWM